MRAPKERFDFVHEFVNRVFIDDLHAKRVLSLANGTLGVMSGACLAVSLIGQALAKARGLFAKSAIKQVDRLLSNAGVVPWDLFGSWVREVVGERREIVVAMELDRFRRRQSGHVGGDQDPRISGAFAAEPPEVEGAGGALRQFPARTKSLKDPMGWPRNPVVASLTVAEGRRHPRGATNLAGIYQRRGSESGTSNLP